MLHSTTKSIVNRFWSFRNFIEINLVLCQNVEWICKSKDTHKHYCYKPSDVVKHSNDYVNERRNLVDKLQEIYHFPENGQRQERSNNSDILFFDPGFNIRCVVNVCDIDNWVSHHIKHIKHWPNLQDAPDANIFECIEQMRRNLKTKCQVYPMTYASQSSFV